MNKENWYKKGIGLLLGLLLMLTLSGCSFGMDDVKASVMKPHTPGISIEGRYVFQDVINLEEGKFVDETNFSDFTAEFSMQGARVGLEQVELPGYISKLVNTFDYFLEKYRVNPSRLKLTKESLEVIRINSTDRAFYEVFRLDEEHIAVVKGNNFITLSRVQDEPAEVFIMDEAASEEFGGAPEAAMANDSLFEPRAGVLIGLRGERDEETLEQSYRTLWITNDGEIQEVYEVDNILFPRKEFWKLEVQRDEVDGTEKERLNIYAITGTPSNVKDKIDYNYPSTFLEVEFVGNNYVSLVSTESGDASNANMPKAMTISVDNYNNYRPANINELDPKDGVTAFINSADQVIEREEALEKETVSKENLFSSFILKRHHGYWMMESRLLAMNEENEEQVYKVPIALKPVRDIVTYDDLTVPWVSVKERVPQAIDAFNAPGNSFLLVRTPKYLMMYNIIGVNEIAEEPLQLIEIKEEEEIIMAEWARGEFVKRWTDVVSAHGRKIIFVQNRK
ncbi:hypothetical protein ACHAL6_14440 [Proteiniclasticum sp. C24MP]|uniref:hypothetical protein n=1 Tax=Proteiniclasticum sp. C24MP TaxID=3374101 RepID=UPI0037552BC8